MYVKKEAWLRVLVRPVRSSPSRAVVEPGVATVLTLAAIVSTAAVELAACPWNRRDTTAIFVESSINQGDNSQRPGIF